MKDTIQKELAQIEQTQNVRLLLAVESGSRAWGFASPDSDYDVRFIYVRPKDAYLRLQKHRDVIELPINDALDINGWDLTKTLRLLHKSNPTLFEWGASPIVYLETDFAARFKSVMGRYFSSKRGLYHYIHMAAGNYREYIKGDMIKAKKYFYVLRPVLACRWILDKGSPPPMLFSELMESGLAPELKPEVERLLELKVNSPEIRMIPQIRTLNEYLSSIIAEIEQKIARLPNEREIGWEELNELFLSQLM